MSLLTQISHRFSSTVHTLQPAAPVLAGATAGAASFVWTHQFVSTFGTSVHVASAFAVGLPVSLGLACWLKRWMESSSWHAAVRPAAWVVLALWTISFSWLLRSARAGFAPIPVTWLEVDAAAFGMLFVTWGCLLLAPFCACILLGLPAGSDRHAVVRSFPLSSRFVAACGLTLGLTPVVWGHISSVDQLGMIVTALAVIGFWVSSLQSTRPEYESLRGNSWSMAGSSMHRHTLWWSVLACGLIGLWCPLVQRTVMQFIPGTGAAHFALWAGLLFGTAGGAAWSSRAEQRRHGSFSRDGVMMAGVITILWPIALLAMWPLLLRVVLLMNSYVANVWLLTAFRGTLAFGAMFPLGIAFGRSWSQSPSGAIAENRLAGTVLPPLGFCLGMLLMQWFSLPQLIVQPCLLFAAVVLVGARVWVIERFTLRRKHVGFMTAAVVCVGAFPVVRHAYRPDLSAKLLFSTQSFAAHNAGIERRLLPHLDDGRLVSLRDNGPAVWTVWKHRGSQLLFRRNGIPVSLVSTNPTICPQFAGDVMPAVLPLVVHPRPEQVLLVGLGSTATLSTCLACPVRHITCVEGDRELIALARNVVAPMSGLNPLADDRVELRDLDPNLAFLGNNDAYDVVILRDSQPFLMGQSTRFTREYYERVSAALNEGGVVCQCLQYADFGRKPIEEVLATLQAVFPQVACFESAPGEMIVLSTNTETSLFNASLVKRCEASHIRRLLAQLGWDWSVMLNLAAISPAQVDQLSAAAGRINTVANGRFTYRLPGEVMRWGPKAREIQSLIAQRGSRMLNWLGDAADTQAIAQRLADMSEQHRLIIEHPDQYWAYRATLKDRLTERPRSQIVQVKNELQRALHPEDERRKVYLEVLGNAATQTTPKADDIARLVDFVEPYDPLVSYFLHGEAARLYSRAESPDRIAQFAHVRYLVHFGPQLDASVQNVVAALELLLDDPSLVPTPAERFDELNSLLDALRQRAMVRAQTDRTASPFELVDAEKAIRAAERAMRVLDELHDDAQVSAGDWRQRRVVLERMLVRPMWSYHAQQAQRLATLESRKHLSAASDESEATR